MKNHILSLLFFTFVSSVLLIPSEIFAVGFFVRPTLVNLQAKRGETKQVLIEVLNKTPNSEQELEAVNVVVSQGIDGVFGIFDIHNIPDGMSPRFIDCSSWIQPQTKLFSIDPLQSFFLPVNISIPQNASGTYLGGLIIQSNPASNKGIGISLRFLIRFEIKITGTSNRSSVIAQNSTLTTRDNPDNNQLVEYSNIQLINTGDNPLIIDGSVSLLQQDNQKWRRMMTLPVGPIRIYPGSNFLYGTNLPRRIPSGQYRLDYKLSADGKNIKAPSSILDFVGDPAISGLVADAEISLTPSLQMTTAGPKASRSFKTILRNNSDQPTIVHLNIVDVPELKGVSIGSRMAEDLNQPQWFKLRKNEFHLRPKSSRPVICTVTCPDTNLVHPVYYGKISAISKYEDGQFAGSVESIVSVGIKGIPKNPDLRLRELSFAKTENNNTRVIIKTANIGGIHVIPEGTLTLTNLSKTQLLLREPLQGPETWVLPFGTPNIYCDIDLNRLTPGQYKISCQVNYEGGTNSIEEIVQVSESKDGKSISLFETSSTQ